MYKYSKNAILLFIMLLLTSCSVLKSTNEAFSESVIDLSDNINFTEQSDTISAVSTDIGDEKLILDNGYNSDIKDYCKKILEFAFNEYEKTAVLLNGKENKYECGISLMNVCGNDTPEMILSLRSEDDKPSEYIFAVNENGEPICIGAYALLTEFDGLYTNPLDNTYYIILCGSHSAKSNLNRITVNKLELPLKSKVSPDLAEYQSNDALSFMENTQLYFIRYDDEDWNNPENGAAMFYYEDSYSYEAYSVSKQILDLTSVEINDYINGEGNHIYSYLPGENYLVSRQEYEQIKSKVFEILTQVTDEPEISSGWINIDEIDTWIDSLV